MAVEVSRRDVPSERIIDLQSETRFLKLPVDPYLELLGIEPLPSQKAIINAINNDKYRFVRQKLYQPKVQRTRQPKFTWCSFGNTKGN